MAITQEKIAERLKAAREAAGLSQLEVSESLGIPRTAIVQLEAGRRGISSLELEHLARLYGRGIGEFVSSEEFSESPVTALFRASPSVANNPALKRDLLRVEGLCREATNLEHQLGRDQTKPTLIQYDSGEVSSRWDAILQGRQLAEQERNRLGLGVAPVWEIAEVIKRQGIRVVEADLADEVSGVFLHGKDIGSIIIVNKDHGDSRKLFSCAHEYCHALVDRALSATMSQVSNREDIAEIRANSFAAYFLMPEEGVRRYLNQIGKGPESRLVHQVFPASSVLGDTGELAAQKRSISARKDLQLHDIVGLAYHFGVSFEAALYQLMNLKLLYKSRFDEFKEQKLEAKRIGKAMGFPDRENDLRWLLTNQVLELGLEAYRRGMISRGKLLHVARELGVTAESVFEVLDAEGVVDEPVEPVFPG